MWTELSLLLPLVGLTLRPYVPPALGPEPAYQPSAVKRVEILPARSDAWDANVFARPVYTAPLVGHVARGSVVPVRGELVPGDKSYCATGLYYALEPFGWLCSADAEPTARALTLESVLALVDGTPVPYAYAMVVLEEGALLPMWSSLESLYAYESPERELSRGDTIAIASVVQFEGQSHYLTVDDKIVPVTGTTPLKRFSAWQGVEVDASTHLPFAWVTPNKAPVFDAPKGKKIEDMPRRARVDILEELTLGAVRWVRIGEGRYMKADQLNEVRKLDQRPEGTGVHEQWIDVDLGEQVVVAYRNQQPVFATLTSSGREPNHTPRGNYPVWGKSTAITMKSQDYDDAPYYVNRVPWVMFFQAHNALHAAYWHDRFGMVKSHGCGNLSPRDAKYLFDWLAPRLPPGWTSVRYWDLTQAPVVHVRNSRRNKPFFQERNIGPPNAEDETERVEAALVRREAKEREEAARLAKEQVGAPMGPLPMPQAQVPSRGPLVPLSPLQ